MKIKNIALATIAFTFAVVGAFASMLTSETVYVWAKSSSTADPACLPTTASCNYVANDTETPCRLKVTVSNTNVTPQTVTSINTLKTYRSGCTEILYDTDGGTEQVINMSSSIYQIIAK